MQARAMIKLTAMVAAGGLLVAVAVTGTRAMADLDVEFRPVLAVPDGAIQLVILAAAVLCLPLLIVGMVLRRRARRAEQSGDVEWLRRLVFLAVLVASVLVLRELLPTNPEEGTTTDAGTGEAQEGPADVLFSGWTAVLAATLAAAAGIILWWRRHTINRTHGPSAATPRDDTAAVRAGQAALDQPWEDPREAVVACYAAMEQVLAETGSARRRAETPEELLQRAIGEARLAPTPGRALTGLFLAARYSSASVTAADVAAARDALRSIETGVPSWS